MTERVIQQQESKKKASNFFLSYGIFFVLLIIIIVYSITSKYFLTSENIIGVLLNANSLIIIAIGMTFVVLTGDLDLSVGSVAYFAAATSMVLLSKGFPMWLSIVIAILSGAAFGLLNAVFIVLFRLSSMLITLGMMIGVRGLALQLTNNKQIFIPEFLKDFSTMSIKGIPIIIIIALTLLIIAQLVLSYTKLGKYIIATGCSYTAACKVGINARAIKFTVFVISGSLAGIGGLVSMINMGAALPSLGNGMEFLAVSAVVLGGTSLFGGKGSLLPGTFIGVLVLVIVENGLSLLGASPYLYPFVRGLIIFVAMYADSLKLKRSV